jgi:uncharacterized protein (DUF302 family)
LLSPPKEGSIGFRLIPPFKLLSSMTLNVPGKQITHGSRTESREVWLLSVSENGVVRVASGHPFADTFDQLKFAVVSRGLTVFASIDFSEDAERAGSKMLPTRLLIFGSPKAGTPLMVAAPTLAIDLPLKVLVSEDENGRVWVSYNSLRYLKDRHNIPDELLKNISGIISIVESVVG